MSTNLPGAKWALGDLAGYTFDPAGLSGPADL